MDDLMARLAVKVDKMAEMIRERTAEAGRSLEAFRTRREQAKEALSTWDDILYMVVDTACFSDVLDAIEEQFGKESVVCQYMNESISQDTWPFERFSLIQLKEPWGDMPAGRPIMVTSKGKGVWMTKNKTGLVDLSLSWDLHLYEAVGEDSLNDVLNHLDVFLDVPLS